MRLVGITPIVVSDGELRRRQARYTELAPVGVTIDLVNLKDGPARLETSGEIRSSEDLVYEQVIRMDVGGHDGVFLDCVLDPALERLQAYLDIPVFGITNLVSSFLGSLGLQMAAVARNGTGSPAFLCSICPLRTSLTLTCGTQQSRNVWLQGISTTLMS